MLRQCVTFQTVSVNVIKAYALHDAWQIPPYNVLPDGIDTPLTRSTSQFRVGQRRTSSHGSANDQQ
jgi:hypothetical protein